MPRSDGLRGIVLFNDRDGLQQEVSSSQRLQAGDPDREIRNPVAGDVGIDDHAGAGFAVPDRIGIRSGPAEAERLIAPFGSSPDRSRRSTPLTKSCTMS